MNRKMLVGALLLISLMTVAILALATLNYSFTPAVRSKSPAVPLSDDQSPENRLAQDLALSDTRVQELTVGRRSEVFGVLQVGQHYSAAAKSCFSAVCRQVNIYNWDENAAISVIVDVDRRAVLDVMYQPGIHPGINKRLAELAIELAVNDPGVIEVLGYKPDAADVGMAPVDADAPGTTCDGIHLCVAPTFDLGDRILWVMVDLTEEQVAGLRWTTVFSEDNDGLVTFSPSGGCPAPGTVTRDGWSLNHEVTGSDGLRAYDITHNGQAVATSVKLVEWHADYGSSGFRDATGCSGSSGSFPIYPYGETQVIDLIDEQSNVIGFEVVQDFRMSSWGNSCNYRYEQHLQFYDDGRFRVVSGAYGKGCGTNALYRPLVRIDIAVDGDDGDTFAYWHPFGWADQVTELYRTPYSGTSGPHYLNDDGYAWRVMDDSGIGYYLEPGVGQFGDGGRGDDPFIYATLHQPSEGDTDLGSLGSCCNDDHRQGPDIYVDGEAIDSTNIVLWYVPQMLTDAVDDGDGYYCWTLGTAGNPGPTYPCFSGPMFVPFESEPTDPPDPPEWNIYYPFIIND